MKPAIFNTEMVRAILDGRKMQTRRVITDLVCIRNAYIFNEVCCDGRFEFIHIDDMEDFLMFNPPYKVGDIIYVRETWNHTANESDLLDHEPRNKIGGRFIVYRADGEQIHPIHGKSIWKPSIHMPKEYARVFLRVKDVRIEQLNEISEDDAISEGAIRTNRIVKGYTNQSYSLIEYHYGDEERSGQSPSDAFGLLWESIYGNGSFDNRYVLVIEFERISKEEAING